MTAIDSHTGFILRQFSPNRAKILISIKNYLKNTLFVVFKSYGTIMFITFIELSGGLILIDVPNPILIAMIIAAFDILPLFGTGGIMVPWVILISLSEAMEGRWGCLYSMYCNGS